MIIDWNKMTWQLATTLKVVHRGTQILWVKPHTITAGWVVSHEMSPRPFYAHTGD